MLGLVSSATFAGYLAGLLLAGRLAARHGSRAPTTVGGACGAAGAVLVTFAQAPWLPAVGVVLAGSAGGWVWAPYSGIVTRSVPLRQQPRALAIIATGALARRMGSSRVAALSLVTVAAALALLGLASDSLTATMASAGIFGVGYMTGSAVLAVWTAELVPGRAGAAFTACLVVGAVSSVAAPAIAGAVIPGLVLGALLVLTAAVSLSSGVALLLHGSTRGATVGGTGP